MPQRRRGGGASQSLLPVQLNLSRFVPETSDCQTDTDRARALQYPKPSFPRYEYVLKPSLRYDYPLTPPNSASRPIRDLELMMVFSLTNQGRYPLAVPFQNFQIWSDSVSHVSQTTLSTNHTRAFHESIDRNGWHGGVALGQFSAVSACRLALE